MTEKSILLIGNCVVDTVIRVDEFPVEDGEYRALALDTVAGGNALNSARVLKLLDENCHFMASLGRDSSADFLLNCLSELQIDSRYCAIKPGATPCSFILLNKQNGSRTILHQRDLEELEVTDFEALDFSLFSWVHAEGRNISVLKSLLSKIRRSNDCRISVELEKHRADIFDLIPDCHLVVISKSFLAQIKLSAKACLQQLLHINPQALFVVTLGEAGLLAYDPGQGFIEIAAHPVQHVIDTIGAGDSFIGALLKQLNQGAEVYSALEFANRFAAEKVQQMGFPDQLSSAVS